MRTSVLTRVSSFGNEGVGILAVLFFPAMTWDNGGTGSEGTHLLNFSSCSSCLCHYPVLLCHRVLRSALLRL